MTGPVGGERQALTTALAIWMAAVAAFALGSSDPWWAAISALMVSNPDRDALVLKSALRVTGTVIGCIIGYFATLAFEGQPVVLALFLFGINAFAMLMRFRSRYSYAWLLGAITVDMVMIDAIQSPGELFSIAVFRGTEINLGVIAALIAALVIGRDVHGPPTAPKPPPAPMEDIHAAIIAGLMLPVILVGWSLFDLPSVLQIVVSAIAVADRDMLAMRTKGAQRILGCFLGGALGLGVAATGLDAFLPWSAVFIAGLFAFAHLHHGPTSYSYVGTQGALALIVAMVTGPGPPSTIGPIVERLAGMLLGVLLLLAVVAIMRPVLERLLPVRHAAA